MVRDQLAAEALDHTGDADEGAASTEFHCLIEQWDC